MPSFPRVVVKTTPNPPPKKTGKMMRTFPRTSRSGLAGIVRRLIQSSAIFLLCVVMTGTGSAIEIIQDNSDLSGVVITGAWTSSTAISGYYGVDCINDGNGGKGTKSVRYTPTISTAGQYLVYMRWTPYSNRASNVPVTITHAGGAATVTVDQRTGTGWILLGTYSFNAGTSGNVLVSNTGTSGYVIADGMKFVSVDPTPTEIVQDNADATGITMTGSWTASTSTSGYHGSNYYHDSNAGKGTKSIRFTPTIPTKGNYSVYLKGPAAGNYASNAPVSITHARGTSNVKVDQRIESGAWVYAGTYLFNTGTAGSVLISNAGTSGFVIADAVRYVPSPESILDNTDSTGVTFTGTWAPSTSVAGYYGADYTTDGNYNKGNRSVRFTPDLATAGVYEVLTRWTSDSNRANDVPIDIAHQSATEQVFVDQQVDGGQWISLGLYDFAAGTDGSVTIKTTGTTGHVIADAVKFVPQIVVDNTDASRVALTGAWTASTITPGYYGSNYLHDGNTAKGTKTVRFTPTVTFSGRYDVYACWTSSWDRASNTPVTITSAGGTTTVRVDQRTGDGEWMFLGNHQFHAGTSGNILFSNAGTAGYVVVDAICLAPHNYPANRVSVVSPGYGTDINGDTPISIVAPGFTSATAKCWQPGGTYGSETTVATLSLNSAGDGSFVFPADSYPHGPITIQITGTNGTTSDNCYLQLYNTGGVSWKEGIPASAPPAATAAGLSLVYSDDFTTMPSISANGAGATYSAHKPGGGDFSGIPFADPTGPGNPFSQVDSYLRIRADANKNTTGLISSLRGDGTGFLAHCPAYFECRFIAPSAPGTWPAFWLLSYNGSNFSGPTDELDIIEAYGGEGSGMPNAPKAYQINTHNWNQTGIPTNQTLSKTVNMATVGGGAGWLHTPHVYGCLVTATDTVYYLDNNEVGRHQTSPLSKTDGFWFMINLAVGGASGWHKDLGRYNGIADMYVDYVRVYAAP